MNPLPKFNELMLPILQFLRERGALENHQIRELAIERFNISPEVVEQRLPSGNQTHLDNRLGWAKTYLFKAGLIDRPKRATIKITKTGEDLLDQNPSYIDVSLLRQYDGINEFLAANKDLSEAGESKQEIDTESTPEDQIEKAIFQIRRELKDELLQRIMHLPPEGFEQLVLRLLVGMGYGGSMADVQGVARGADGGVDGMVNQDHLGLDRIYIQAKRWEGSVGRPVIQGFVGALAGVGASKGVIMTTSTFAQPAQEYVKALTDRRIILVDGNLITTLMLKHGIGVSTRQSYEIQRMDEDFFLELED